MRPEELAWSYNGIRPDGEPFSMDPATFIQWAAYFHPEYIDFDTGDLVPWFVVSKEDAEASDMPEMEGTVAVTIRPDIDGNISYAQAATLAARAQTEDVLRDRFLQLAKKFEEENFTVKIPE